MPTIGFIGLGIMGLPMSKNLVKKGYKVIGYNRSQTAMDALQAAGGTVATSIAQLSEKAQVIITMLPDSPDVKAVALGEGGILHSAKAGTLYIDMSSIEPLVAREVHTALAAKGIRMLDAPVSGGEPKAIDGTLSVMAGGSEADFAEAQPIFAAMAASAVRVGDIGAGNVCKLANQIVVALNIAAVAEALSLATKAGVDPQLVYQAIRGGLAGSTVMDAKAPMMLSGNEKPGFKVKLHIKDMNNVQQTAHAIGAPLPLSAIAMEILQAVRVDGRAEADHSTMARFYEKLANIRLAKA